MIISSKKKIYTGKQIITEDQLMLKQCKFKKYLNDYIQIVSHYRTDKKVFKLENDYRAGRDLNDV